MDDSEQTNAISIAALEERSKSQGTSLKSMEDRINSIEKKVDAGFTEMKVSIANIQSDIRWSLAIAGGLGAGAYAIMELVTVYFKK